MKYYLMHKNINVALLEIDSERGKILKIYETYDHSHLPVGVRYRKGLTERTDLDEWWSWRLIPKYRSGLSDALKAFGTAYRCSLLTRCYGLSLSDQYWVKPENSDLIWDKVNFFDNPFSSDVGDILFGKQVNRSDINFMSPDITTDGNLKKRWIVENGKRLLIKAGSEPYVQQPFNEVIASVIMRRLGVPHIDYKLVWDGITPYCACENFVTHKTELVTAWRLMITEKQRNDVSRYQHCVSCYEKTGLGLRGIIRALDQMITVDFIIANEDRHLNNFGVIRNAETLEYFGFAPIFDSGSSLGYEQLPAQIRGQAKVECKPFKIHHKEQLKLVTSFDWLDFSKLEGISDEIEDVFSDKRTEAYISEQRITAIVNAVEYRIEQLREFAEKMNVQTATDTTDNDVKVNTARTY